MKTVPVTLRGEGTAIEYQLRLALDSSILDFRLNAQTMVGFDDHACRWILGRTGEPLKDDLLLAQADVQGGDVLTVAKVSAYVDQAPNHTPQTVAPKTAPPPSSYRAVESAVSAGTELLVPYKLVLVIRSPQQSQWEYDIHLKQDYENNPRKFFEAYGGQEYQNLADFLRSILSHDPSPREIDRLLSEWCEDISMGHRRTVLPIK